MRVTRANLGAKFPDRSRYLYESQSTPPPLWHSTCLFLSDEPDVPGRESRVLDILADVVLVQVLSQAANHDRVVGLGVTVATKTKSQSETFCRTQHPF